MGKINNVALASMHNALVFTWQQEEYEKSTFKPNYPKQQFQAYNSN